jgi:DNA-binding response OmpR family regulator
MSKKILVVDDDPTTLTFVERELRKSGFDVQITVEGSEAIRLIQASSPDLILLDAFLPGMDGYTLTGRIKEFAAIPVIILSARGEERDKLRGFEAGVDDYIIKPFSSAVLIARINAVLRRYDKAGLEKFFLPVYRHADLVIDVESFRVTVGGEEVVLSSTEFKLLTKFAESKGEILSSEELLSSIWGPDFRDDKTILWVALSRLKQKIEKDPKNPEFIQTIKGVGYLMPEED